MDGVIAERIRQGYSSCVHPAELPQPARWWYALKPGSWPKLVVPALLGQAIGVSAAGASDYLIYLTGYQNIHSLITGFAALLNIIINFAVISQFGIFGVAAVTTFIIILKSVVLHIVAYRKLEVRTSIFFNLI